MTPTKSTVLLLKWPHPYRAALTVCSDTHGTPIRTFQAVHTLVNTESRILRGSEEWACLFEDPEIERRGAWSSGIDGFGLPISDTLWLFSPSIGVFAGFDAAVGEPIPHSTADEDLRDLWDEWLRAGYADALHTPGQGDVPREATAAGLEWLGRRPHGKLRVWVNHSYEVTPACMEPNPTALRPVLRNLIRLARGILGRVGLDRLLARLVDSDRVRPFPAGQGALLWSLGAMLTASLLWLAATPFVPWLRGPWMLSAGLSALLASLVTLSTIRVQYAQGDVPGSRYYVADLVKRFGIRYHWLIQRHRGYEPLTEGTLVLPERVVGEGRPSCFSIVTLDDGSRILAFPRAYLRSPNGVRSLELLSDENLDELVERQGLSVIYTHWTSHPKRVFTAPALDGLVRLRRNFREGRIWVAPTSDILHFAFIRAFVEFEVQEVGGQLVIDVLRVKDPIDGSFVPALEDLRGLGFVCSPRQPIEVRIAGAPAPRDQWEVLTLADRVVAHFKLDGRGG
jgi:hypothetical protein